MIGGCWPVQVGEAQLVELLGKISQQTQKTTKIKVCHSIFSSA